jgi:hypothetical protein
MISTQDLNPVIYIFLEEIFMSFCDDDEEINDYDIALSRWEKRNKQEHTFLFGGHRYTKKEFKELFK